MTRFTFLLFRYEQFLHHSNQHASLTFVFEAVYVSSYMIGLRYIYAVLRMWKERPRYIVNKSIACHYVSIQNVCLELEISVYPS